MQVVIIRTKASFRSTILLTPFTLAIRPRGINGSTAVDEVVPT